MPNWKTTLDLRDIWDKRSGECGREDWTDKTVHELAKEIARRLERKFPRESNYDNWDNGCDYELCDIIGYFRDVPTHQDWLASIAECENEGYDADPVRHYTPLREFNDIMNDFYDWCDENRVWVDK